MQKEDLEVRLERKSYPTVWFVNETSIFRDNYPAKWNEELVRFLIEMFTEPGEKVADFMCGAGCAVIEALKLKRTAYGSDINPEAVQIVEERLEKESINKIALRLDICDARNIETCGDASCDLVLISPPFGNSIDAKHDQYSKLNGDIGNSKTMEEWRKGFKPCLKQFFLKTKPGRLCIVEVRPRRVHWKDKPLWKWVFDDAIEAGFDWFNKIIEIQQPYSKFPVKDFSPIEHRHPYPTHSELLIFQRPEDVRL